MLQKGCVVRSVAGHDKDRFYVVLDVEKGAASIADGRVRMLAKPKRKNIRHVRVTNTVLNLSAEITDKKLRTLLKPFYQGESCES